MPKRFRSDGERKAAFAHMKQKHRWSRQQRQEYVTRRAMVTVPELKNEHEKSEPSASVISPQVRMVFDTSFAAIASVQPFVGELFVCYKLVNAIYSVAKAYGEQGPEGVAKVIGKEVISGPLTGNQGTLAWNLIANNLDPSFHVVAKALLEECVDGITNEEIDFVSRSLAQ